MNPDITKYFFTVIRSKLPADIRLEIFRDPVSSRYAYAALSGNSIVQSGTLDETRFDQVSYLDWVLQEIINSVEAHEPLNSFADLDTTDDMPCV